jgi:hypothetical protein
VSSARFLAARSTADGAAPRPSLVYSSPASPLITARRQETRPDAVVVDYYFLFNASDAPNRQQVELGARGGVESIDLWSGKRAEIPAVITANGVAVEVDIGPKAALMLRYVDEYNSFVRHARHTLTTAAPSTALPRRLRSHLLPHSQRRAPPSNSPIGLCKWKTGIRKSQTLSDLAQRRRGKTL